MRALLLVPALLLAALAASCSDPRRPDVLLVSLDTLRADHLSCYGYERPTSPFLDRLAREGVRFERAWASASNTAPSHMSLFTGLDPFAHGIRPVVAAKEEIPALSSAFPTLPELLQRAGYATVAVSDDGFILPQMGFGRGFDTFRNERTTLPTKLTQLEQELRDADPGRPLFLFFHTYETHAPYIPPRAYHGRFTDPAHRGEFRRRYEELVDKPLREAWDARGTFLVPFDGMGEEDLAFLRGLYDEGIAYTDDMLRRAWTLWSRRRDAERTVLVVLSDHGEGFLEHGRLGHQYGLYAELLRVPLLLRAPGVAPRVVASDVGLVDVAPTVLELAGLIPPPGLQGRSLAALARGRAEPALPAISQLNSRRGPHDAVASGDLHLLRWRRQEGTRTELYDLGRDPREAADRADERAEDVRALEAVLDRRSAAGFALAERHPAGSEGELSPSERTDLNGLGYLGGEGDDPAPRKQPKR